MLSTRSLLLPLAALAACAVQSGPRRVAPALEPGATAYEAALRTELPKAAPESAPGLHNVFRLSEHIVSGSEPEGDEAFARLADMGIKTILSVDGKSPDAARAAAHGLRYVHVPIRYKGFEANELAAISKTFRELDGPFYVHCFHGKHRGPATAAVGRVVLDGASRDQAIAEMRQWCGTSKKYEGLYAAIAYGELPDATRTANLAFDFPAQHRFGGLRQLMVDLSRSFETLEALEANGWQTLSEHPDANAGTEARRMAEALGQAVTMDGTAREPEDFRRWLQESADASREIVDLVGRLEQGDAEAGVRAAQRLGDLKQRCASCHESYRN